MKTKEQILIETFDNYGSFVTIEDVRQAFKENPEMSMVLVQEAMEVYAGQEQEATEKINTAEFLDYLQDVNDNFFLNPTDSSLSKQAGR